jgi:UDP-2,3-diacylglucosamine pyrophosphatase LpxH
VLHGDLFDRVTSSMRWLAKLGDVGYSFLLWVNGIYNRRRILKGLPYYSIAKEIKKKVKASVSYISDFEQHIVDVARSRECDGVICGHIHQPEIRMYGDVLYLNSGDWIESLSALTEDYDGNWSIYRAEEDKK